MLSHYDVKLLFVLPIVLFATKTQSQNIEFQGVTSRIPYRRSCEKDYYCTLPENCPHFRRSNQGMIVIQNDCSSPNVLRICCPRPESRYRNRRPSKRPPPTTQKPTTISQPVVTKAPAIKHECGHPSLRSQSPYVRGGQNAKEGAWPWMAAIKAKMPFGIYVPICTGFLIDQKHVITAAHCMNESKFFTASMGSIDIKKSTDFPVEKYFVHEKYKSATQENDIAILKLKKEVNFTPICLPDVEVANKNLIGLGTTVAGWGREVPGGKMSNILNQLSEIPVLSYDFCAERLRYYGIKVKIFENGLENDFICAKVWGKDKDACKGDSGGPLMFQDRNRWFAVGIVAFGTDCQYNDFPSAYTKVSRHLKWIKEKIKN